MNELRLRIGDGDAFDPADKYGMELKEAENRFGPPKKAHAVSSYIEEPGEHLDPRAVADAFDYKIGVLITARHPDTVAKVIAAFNNDIKETDEGGVDRYKTLSIILPDRDTAIVGTPNPIETTDDFFTWRNEQCAVAEISMRVNDPTKCRWGSVGSSHIKPGEESFTLKYKRSAGEFVFSDELTRICAENDVRLYCRHAVHPNRGMHRGTRDPSRKFRRVCHSLYGGALCGSDWRDDSLRITSPADLKSEMELYVHGVNNTDPEGDNGLYVGGGDRFSWWSKFMSGVTWGEKSGAEAANLAAQTPFTTVYTTFALGICADEGTKPAIGSIIDGTVFRLYFDGATGVFNLRTKKGWVK